MPEITVKLPQNMGLHARPAARFIEKAKALPASLRVRKGGREADARSILGLLSLDIGKGSAFTLIAEGEGAQAALDELIRFLCDELAAEVRG
ncbi:MAG: HPr family phosphocarrier protein [Armatimonadetes bacterium]|nr:HPr family phosphocarrier protein [Armatimonadota bacterium]